MHNTYFNYTKNLSASKKAYLIKEAGFSGVFLYYSKDIDEEAKIVREHGLDIEAIHLDVLNCNHLWLDTLDGEEYINITKAGIKAASRNNIKTVVFHISSKDNPPKYNELGLNRLRDILDLCEELDVNFALENLRRLDYLDYIFDNLNSNKLKFCFDSGHANAYTKNIENFEFEKYSDKLICVHFSDNFGNHDSHLIPLTGNIDWKKLAKNLKSIKFNGPLTSEAIIDAKKDPLTELRKIKKSLEIIEEYLK